MHTIKQLIPKKLIQKMRPVYHYTLAFLSALIYRFPSRKIFVIAVTGTKGKSSVSELINAILEEAGYKTSLSNTIRFKTCDTSSPNRLKMTMPGRFFLQRFLRRAVKKKCDYAIVEMTSEGARQFRHKFISLNALIFTNLSPEHIESHGSYENYRNAKLSIAKLLERGGKERRIIVANKDDKEGGRFLTLPVKERYSYSLEDGKPFTLKKDGLEFTLNGKRAESSLSGEFNLYNILAAVTLARALAVGDDTIISALQKFHGIPGRMERIDAGQDFTVVVDYAHTADSLMKVYEVFQDKQKICVLGSTGGGRDTWKRKEMGAIANTFCSHIILTNEDPYDEDPLAIISDVKEGVTREIVDVIVDRREAIRHALASAKTGDAVIITGKGTDPYIMGPKGSRLPWSDKEVTKEELAKIKKTS